MPRFALISFWFNPNIQPSEEYDARRASLVQYVSSLGLTLLDGPSYPQDQWLAQAGTAADRCAFCYRLRLEEAARTAREQGITHFSTTLLASPYQKHDLVRAAGDAAGALHGVTFVYEDARGAFYRGKDIARAQGSYIQKYCGCLFSRAERAREHAAKKEQHTHAL